MDTKLGYALEGIAKAQTVEEARAAYMAYSESHGFDHLHFIFGDSLADMQFVTSCPDWWMPHYLCQDYFIDDQLAHLIFDGHGVMLFGVNKFGRNSGISAGFENVLQDVQSSLGVSSGITFPVFSPTGRRIGGANVSSSMSIDALKKVPAEVVSNLTLAATVLHQKCYSLHFGFPDCGALTERERECLQWLASGKQTKEIGRILYVSDATVNFHIANAKRKMGAETREQAVARAIMRGVICL